MGDYSHDPYKRNVAASGGTPTHVYGSDADPTGDVYEQEKALTLAQLATALQGSFPNLAQSYFGTSDPTTSTTAPSSFLAGANDAKVVFYLATGTDLLWVWNPNNTIWKSTLLTGTG